jgi:hypothetical protein
MLIYPSSQPDFSRGCAGMSIGHLLFATHPHPSVREWAYASAPCLRILAAANLYSPLSNILCWQ